MSNTIKENSAVILIKDVGKFLKGCIGIIVNISTDGHLYCVDINDDDYYPYETTFCMDTDVRVLSEEEYRLLKKDYKLLVQEN